MRYGLPPECPQSTSTQVPCTPHATQRTHTRTLTRTRAHAHAHTHARARAHTRPPDTRTHARTHDAAIRKHHAASPHATHATVCDGAFHSTTPAAHTQLDHSSHWRLRVHSHHPPLCNAHRSNPTASNDDRVHCERPPRVRRATIDLSHSAAHDGSAVALSAACAA